MNNEWARRAPQEAALPADYFTRPSPARTWNYLQGGKDNYALDRHAAEVMAANYPGMFHMAEQARHFLARAVRHVATEGGVRQYLDLGCGLPAPPNLPNLHEVAQAVHPDARVVYVDNDMVVLAHARALLTPVTEQGVCAYLDADVRDIEQILTEAADTLDFRHPVSVSMLGVLGAVPYDDALRITASVREAVPSGSYLLFDDGIDAGEARRAGLKQYLGTGIGYYDIRTPEQMARFFAGFEMVEPGLVPVTQWRPAPVGTNTARPVEQYGAVARKP
jgi:hypothetical protein